MYQYFINLNFTLSCKQLSKNSAAKDSITLYKFPSSTHSYPVQYKNQPDQEPHATRPGIPFKTNIMSPDFG
jgi:hypothetical protein